VRLACKEDFFNGPIYSYYRHHKGYAKRAKLFECFPDPILVVGCGFGFLLVEFEKLGKEAWGIDASEWAIENRVTERVWSASILDDVDIALLQSQLGAFGLVITEDLLPHLTDEEAKIAARNCSKLSSLVIHMVTVEGQADLTYHSLGQWMNLTNQLTTSLEGM
jgi:2-polyprenyl-3-methyl-5-hydroxy-6-metoxy-1,4-benzoquinol methylase